MQLRSAFTMFAAMTGLLFWVLLVPAVLFDSSVLWSVASLLVLALGLAYALSLVRDPASRSTGFGALGGWFAAVLLVAGILVAISLWWFTGTWI